MLYVIMVEEVKVIVIFEIVGLFVCVLKDF